jgi:membrane-bound lytic murein transglycosylase D
LRLLRFLPLAFLCACAATQPPPAAEPAAGAAAPAAEAPPAATPRPAPAQESKQAKVTPVTPPPAAAPLPPFEGEKMTVEPHAVAKIDRTVAPDDLWQRIRQGFAMPDLRSPIVKKKTAQFAANPEYLQRIFDRSRLYLYYIVEEVEKRGLPTELALLPMVESAFNPMAYSRAHASGLWQFIPGTGKRYSLEQNWWYDERRDVVESTGAALDYLEKLYEIHGDWQLALASYNWGEGAVKRAVAKNRARHKPTDYSSLKMPRETREYVPKLQALKDIISDPAPYGIDLDPIPNEPYFAVVDETPDMDVQLAAQLAEMPVEDFVALNPGFSRPLIRASGASKIVLPADKVQVFRDNLAKRGDDSLVSWEIYHPRKGEKLEGIAKKFHFSVAELKRVNGIRARSHAVPKVLVVPMNGDAGAEAVKLPIMYAPPIESRSLVKGAHVVRKGDTLSSIARRYGVKLADLQRWNPNAKVLHVGQKIYIRKTVR